jgi:hypothetical protein
MKAIEELIRGLEDKLEAVRKMIDEYDESMDYASHCALQGFAEGLDFALSEAKERLGADADAT